MTPTRTPQRGVNFHNGNGRPMQHPHHRDFIPYDRPGHFFGHHHHYFGYRIHALPPHYVMHHYWGHPYYCYDNIWYRPWGDYYVVCRPPYGVCFHPSLVDLTLSAVSFAYYYDLYHTYNVIDSNWDTIAEQNRTIAANNAAIAAQNAQMATLAATKAPESYSLATRLGLIQSFADASATYYYEDGVFFIMGADGEYHVIVPPAGALVDSLPDDYEVVNLGGDQYYKVDDTIYRTVVIDGTPRFEVLGQMQN